MIMEKGSRTSLSAVEIENVLVGSQDVAQTDMVYDQFGNVIQIVGPVDANNVRSTVEYAYETDLNQFVSSVTNAHGESSCYKYEYKFGKLMLVIGLNGHPMQYEYDDFGRTVNIWAPREYYLGTKPTIHYDYHLGMAVPVAVTTHNVEANYGAITVNKPTCGNLKTFPETTSFNFAKEIKTATFVDGLGKTIQVKKDASASNSTGTAIVMREVSGFTKINGLGLPVKSTISFLEPSTASITTLTKQNSSSALSTRFDLLGRPVEKESPTDKTLINYSMTGAGNSLTPIGLLKVEQTTAHVVSDLVIDARGLEVSKINYGNNGAEETKFVYDNLGQLKSYQSPAGVTVSYTYDSFGRLRSENHLDRGTTNNTYDLAGNLIRMANPETGAAGIQYTYDKGRLIEVTYPHSNHINGVKYTYGTTSAGNGIGRIVKVEQGGTFKSDDYRYDLMGNMIYEKKAINVPLFGDQEYTTEFSYVNNSAQVIMAIESPTVYVNPYYVAIPYLQTQMVSKHYYMGAQRVASSMADVPSQIASVPAPGGGEGGEEFASPNLSSADDPVIIDFISTMNCVYDASIDLAFDESLSMPELDQINFHNCEGEEFPPEELAQEDPMCLCEQSVYWGNIYGADCSSRNVMYWYHPDYLGSVEAITDVQGEVYQFFHNTIWGEPLQDQKAFTYKDFSSRFRFNGKERDEETGNYYYGARYYDPKVSVWLSVDAMAAKRTWLTPYNFVQNNPLLRVDPDGNLDICETCPNEPRFDEYRDSPVNYEFTPNGNGGGEIHVSDHQTLDEATVFENSSPSQSKQEGGAKNPVFEITRSTVNSFSIPITGVITPIVAAIDNSGWDGTDLYLSANPYFIDENFNFRQMEGSRREIGIETMKATIGLISFWLPTKLTDSPPKYHPEEFLITTGASEGLNKVIDSTIGDDD